MRNVCLDSKYPLISRPTSCKIGQFIMEMNGGDYMFPFRGRFFRRLELGIPGAILSTASSRDDSTIATCSTDSKVLLWDLSSGKRINCLQGHTAEVTSCSFGDDLLATGARDGIVILWKHRTGKRVSRISFHQGSVQATVISPNGQLLASAGDDGQAIIYQIQNGEGEFISGPENRQMRGHEDAVNDISFSADNTGLLTCSSDGTFQFWDVETSKARLKIQTKYGKLVNAKFTPNGKRVVTLSTNFVSVWDLTTGQLEWELKDEDNRNIQALAVHPFQDLITMVGMDSSLIHQSLHEKERRIVKPTDHKGPILSCNFSPSGRLGMTGGIDGKTLIWM